MIGYPIIMTNPIRPIHYDLIIILLDVECGVSFSTILDGDDHFISCEPVYFLFYVATLLLCFKNY
jgi:hypothetical protein